MRSKNLCLSKRDAQVFVSSLATEPTARLKKATRRYPAESVFGSAAIAKILGVRAKSNMDLFELITRGLPKTALGRCAAWISDDPREQLMVISQIISPSVYRRRRGSLTLVESDMLVRLARVAVIAAYVWGNKAVARQFLTTYHPMLKISSLEACRTDPGAQYVVEILWNLFYGLPAGSAAKGAIEQTKGTKKIELEQGIRALARYERLFNLSLKVVRNR